MDYYLHETFKRNYIVDINNELVPIKSEEAYFDILNGGNANTLN